MNHESPRRSETFVTRKITRAAAEIAKGRRTRLPLGNLDARRDWGYAPEYVALQWRMLQHETPGDYVIGTGESHSVREFLEAVFDYAGLDYKRYVEISPDLMRPEEIDDIAADARKARRLLDWRPQIGFHELVKIMVDADFRALGLRPKGEGDAILRERFPLPYWSGD